MAVRVEKNGPVTTVILDRPEVRNAIDGGHAAALHDAFLAFESDDAARVAVFWGAGGVFCAGADLKFVASGGGEAYAAELQFPNQHGPMGPTRLLLSKPVIAAVSGPAVAGGMELALWCDLRVCEEDSYFGVYCRRWGVPLIDGGTVRLPRLVGMGRALDLILTGRKVSAQEAHTMGLCDRVVPHGTAREGAEALAREIARFPQACVAIDRASVYAQAPLPLQAALQQEFERGVEALRGEGIEGAGRFAAGKGRGGRFDQL
jgi:enoyl-CoA hydratase